MPKSRQRHYGESAPEAHADDCGYRLDQYLWECDCGLVGPIGAWRQKAEATSEAENRNIAE